MSPRVLIDRQEFTPRPAATWAELLEQIDAELDAQGHVINEVQFDGQEQADYRAEPLLRRSLEGIDLIDIQAVSPQALIAGGLREALSSIDPLQRGILDLAIGYRRGEITLSTQRLGVLAEALHNLITIVEAGRRVLGVDLSTTDVDGSVAAAIVGEFETGVAAMNDAAHTRDWIALADSLEYDVAPVLPRIARAIETLATIASPPLR